MSERFWTTIAAIPIFAIGIAALVGLACLLFELIAQRPLMNGLLVGFSFWLVIGVMYLAAKADPY